MQAVMIVLIIFGSIASLFLVPAYLKSQERQKLQDTLRAAIEKGQPLPPEVIEAMTSDVKVRPKPSPQRDLRVGIVWVGVAVGLAAMGLAISFEDADALYPMLGIAAFPGFIGLAFILISFFGRGQKS
ncbi:DUF6249 domain-containing protein [Phenylobacterium aquaticum]|uniref:DUF6249 domain-containing protein n=1 Tax=Phenylobacterium aquaticum TaxID=1763816 RepID=UPI001F5C3952|nr:DUF6249 domain-containing protein [Phenylobacterium aquaticum]MCI3133865.1 DUF6249 domain-containing protein [Phenylobacterium aquaticum]